jgi:ABC-type transport system involved in cytochrome c biogenesis permease component
MQELAERTVEIGQTMSVFLAMARREFLIMSRYPVEFIASFGQIFAIVAMFTLAALTFGGEGRVGTSSPGGVVVYGLTLFLLLSDTLWGIGYNIRREQTQGTLEQLYLSRRRSSAAWFRG